ncbi:unnamed protein product [Candidula unifasciata]|uniref:G-protein coupled receptors family 1 profile domain-containing protein n=1 Tax=Candidula unifasciata TaxID=100452 RepID=A0A8S4A356_9EUPU|nr:unnamed protein product [Candidula unifasciata]
MNLSSNSAPNGTATCATVTNSGTIIVYVTVAIGCVSICESLVVIFVTWFTKSSQGNTNIYILSLAVNDILLVAAYLCNQLSVVSPGFFNLMKSQILTSLHFGLTSGTAFASVEHMAVIAVDRYIQIAHPFYYMKAMTKTRTYIIALSLWIPCLICIIITPTVYYGDQYRTQCSLSVQATVYWYVGVTAYFIIVVMVFLCYFKIAHVAFKHKQSAISRKLRGSVSQADIETKENVTAAVRSVKFFALMFGVFFICTSPPYFGGIISLRFVIPEFISLWVFSLVPLSSIVNFVIYAFMNKEFTASMKNIILTMKRRCCEATGEM